MSGTGAIRDMETPAEQQLAAVTTGLADGTLEVLDAVRRVFRLRLNDSTVPAFADWSAVLHFSADGAFVMAASADKVLAGIRQYQGEPAIAAASPLYGSAWNGTQIDWSKGHVLRQSLALAQFEFKNEWGWNSRPIYQFQGQTQGVNNNRPAYGGYAAFGQPQARAYAYGYLNDYGNAHLHPGNPIRANTGVFVADPSGQFIIGTGGTGKNNLVGQGYEQTFILQR